MSWTGYVFAYLLESAQAVPTGELTLLEEGTHTVGSTFGYGARYLKRPDALPVDPISLPLTSLAGDQAQYEPRGGHPLFGAVRDAAPDFWGRRVIESKLKVPPNSLPESAYLLNAGAHRFGALDFRDNRDDAEHAGALPPIADLGYLLDAADRVQQGLPVPAQLQMLFQVATLGGARPKALVLHKGRQFLAKFPSKGDGFDVPVVERACLELARECGLDVPETDVVTLPDGRNVMLIERFDRTHLPSGEFARKHCVSALTMLGKVEQESLASSYGEIAHAISVHGADGYVHKDRMELYARIAFNILVSNDDDHLRNHAFVWEPQGKAWRLSPLYDVVPHPQVAQERRLHLSVGPQGRAATLTNLLEAHGEFGLLKPAAAQVIDRVAGRVREWRNTFEAWGVPKSQMDLVATAFRRPRDLGALEVEKYLITNENDDQ
jgi:serine/threonine-protein kinase HipA